MSKLGIGIVGCGNISTAYLKLSPLFHALEVRAVADINMEAARQRADEFGVKALSLAAASLALMVGRFVPHLHGRSGL